MADIDKLYRIALENAIQVKDYRKRFAFDEISKKLVQEKKLEGKKPITLLSGVRGTGKTTILLQLFNERENAFYFSADSILLKTERLYSVFESAYRAGYRFFLIDEAHRSKDWVEALKTIYDNFNAQIVASGSSTAAIKKGAIALGRRALPVSAAPLTLGEFFYLREGEKYSASLEEALDRNLAARWLAEHPKAEKNWRDYLSVGGFPGSQQAQEGVFRLIKKMIYEDALAEFSLSKNRVDVSERLLAFLSISQPGEFSGTSFSSMSGYAKSTVFETVQMLKELEILRMVEEESPKAKAKASMKLLFSHPNLRTAVASQLQKEAEIGALREDYFVFHMAELGFPIFIPKKMKKTPDYLVKIDGKRLLFEIGGASKGRGQFEGREGIVMDEERLIVLGFVRKKA